MVVVMAALHGMVVVMAALHGMVVVMAAMQRGILFFFSTKIPVARLEGWGVVQGLEGRGVVEAVRRREAEEFGLWLESEEFESEEFGDSNSYSSPSDSCSSSCCCMKQQRNPSQSPISLAHFHDQCRLNRRQINV
jgi:hypothetical protein